MNDENVKVKFIRKFQKSSKKSRIIFGICVITIISGLTLYVKS